MHQGIVGMSEFTPRIVLVTGGAGFIGSHLTEKLVEQGDQVTVIDNLNTGKEKNLEHVREKIEFVKGDILDEKLIDEITQNVNGVFHEAALASVQDSFTKPDSRINFSNAGLSIFSMPFISPAIFNGLNIIFLLYD